MRISQWVDNPCWTVKLRVNVQVTTYLEKWHGCSTESFVMTKETGKMVLAVHANRIPFCDLAWNDGRRHNRSSLRSIATFITFVILQHGSIILLKECTDPFKLVPWNINMFPWMSTTSLQEFIQENRLSKQAARSESESRNIFLAYQNFPWHWGFLWSLTPSFKLTPRWSRVASALVVKSFKSRRFTQLISFEIYH